MNIFNLPDLGEGLPDAEIHEWFVKEGDTVTLDQPLVSMETAKAVVDVPCPQGGTIVKLFGNPGDVIKTGEPLVAFAATESPRIDKGTVVGNLEESTDISDDNFTIGTGNTTSQRAKATPAVRLLAKKLGVALNTLNGSGEHGVITREDVQAAANKKHNFLKALKLCGVYAAPCLIA
ncbi:dihydrolipoamide acetyltransferase [Legionella feeleii]|uniref:Dihydrolipoamide acetyltransferase n=1 Tax=Legionella feeleii TaxID=453 RepID=A0A2X1QM21_9GAMM|nr:dihydrolipoamide acetyltransferase [Legionella feeleii]